jgi:hypothetical protein
MTEETHSFAVLTDAGLDALLKRALLITLILGTVASLILWQAAGWRNAAMLATGMAISAASIYEWRRLVRIINSHFDRARSKQRTGQTTDPSPPPRDTVLAAAFFLFRLTIFAAAIYGSLKCFRGSVVALLCGLGLAVLAMLWEAVRLLRD